MIFQEETSEEIEKKTSEECYEILKHTGKNANVVKLSDEEFPEFLFNPLFTELCEFDGYFEEVNDKDLIEVMNLKRRYNNIFKYFEAMEVYNRYMEKIIEKYGSKKNLKRIIKYGGADDLYVPPEPKLKQTKENKTLLKCGIVPSRMVPDWNPIFKKVTPLTKEELENWDEGKLTLKDLDKDERKAVTASIDEVNRESRRRGLYSRAYNNPGFDLVQEYYASLESSNRINGKGEHEPLNLSERIKQERKLSEMSATDIEMLDYDKFTVQNGRYVRNSEIAKQELYKVMYENGFDILSQLKGSGMKNKEIKMIRKKIGAFEPLSKKEEKKWKKQEKKYGEKKAAREKADRDLTRLLTGNRISNDGDVRDLMTFTMDSLMRRG